jgi:hypothetical protein
MVPRPREVVPCWERSLPRKMDGLPLPEKAVCAGSGPHSGREEETPIKWPLGLVGEDTGAKGSFLFVSVTPSLAD